MTARVQLKRKKISGRQPQGAWHQESQAVNPQQNLSGIKGPGRRRLPGS
jgi:hypothetical protein